MVAFGWAIEADFLSKDFCIFHNCLLTTHLLKTNDLQIIFYFVNSHMSGFNRLLEASAGPMEAIISNPENFISIFLAMIQHFV